MAEFIVTDPTGKEFVITAPEGATQEQALEFAKSQFSSTQGGAAVGNPNVQRQGEKAMRSSNLLGDVAAPIGIASALGSAFGAAGKEILGGAGNAIGALPYPWARTTGGFLKGLSQTVGAAGRGPAAASGAISGAVGETAGQAADIVFPDSVVIPELTRFAAGSIGPESGKLVPWALRKIGNPTATAAEVIDFIARASGKKENISAAQKAYIEEQIAALRGGAESRSPAERIGSIMGDEGERLMNEAEWRTLSAQFNRDSVKPIGGTRELADVGGDLRATITKRNADAIAARQKQLEANTEARDKIIRARLSSGYTIDRQPEYQAIIEGIEKELKPGRHTPDVQKAFQKVLDSIRPEDKVPPSFDMIDESRRMLGEAFGGKPPEGYDALKDKKIFQPYYFKLRELQTNYAGGKGGPQDKLLSEYAESMEGLQQFSSKAGKKATAIDLYDDKKFATDASDLPKSYFKTRASVQQLKELTGNEQLVNSAALEYANKELSGANAAAARKWLGDNSEWLSQTRPAQVLLERYVTRLETAERSLRNAEDFAKQATRDADILTKHPLPAQRAIDMIRSMDKPSGAEAWLKVAPLIAANPQAKMQMVNAVRQVVADQATAKSTAALFNGNIRPFLEKAGIANADEMDFIAQKLANIQAMKIPESEKLGLAKRMVLQGTSGWAASAASRGGVNAYQWSKEKIVPE